MKKTGWGILVLVFVLALTIGLVFTGCELFSGTPITFTVSSESEWNDAINSINVGGNNREYIITITRDFSVAGRPDLHPTNRNRLWTFPIPKGIAVTIQGSGTISLSSNGALLLLHNRQHIILQDVKLRGRIGNDSDIVVIGGAQRGSLTMRGNASIYSNTGTNRIVAGVGGNGIVTMLDNSSIHNNAFGVTGPGIVTMLDNSSIHSNEYGVFISFGTLTMQNNASVYNNKLGGVFISGPRAVFNMQDETSVHGTVNGYGVFVTVGGTFNMQDSASVYGNTSSESGGGVWLSSGATFRISGGTVYGDTEGAKSNRAPDGAALYIGENWPQFDENTAEYGTFRGTRFTRSGNLETTHNTIRVINGVLQAL